MTESRYTVGIDLGTTNCAVTYVDMAEEGGERRVSVLPIAQLVAPGEVKALPLLPSFIYLPEEHEIPPAALALHSSSQLRIGMATSSDGADASVP